MFVPRITDLADERQLEAMNRLMMNLAQMSTRLTFLDSDGGTTAGRKAYNFDAVWVAYASNASADTEDTVPHNLGRVPAGMLIGVADKAGDVYNGTTTWTSTDIYLKADVTSLTVNLLVF